VVIPLETITSWFSLSDPYCHLSEIFISKDNLGTNYEQIDEIWNFVEVSRSSNFTLTFKNNGSTLTSDKLISVLMEAVTIGNQRSFIEVKITLKALLNKAPYFIENLEKLVIEVKEEEQIAGLA
jgi:archaellum component FlaF (FlaF/FlaG flagellin family)